MFVLRLIGKIAALPLIVLTAIAGFLFNLSTDLSGYVIGPHFCSSLALISIS